MAYAACCGVGGVYVGSLYLASGGTESRDSPAVVWRRIGVACVACSVVWLPVARAFPSEGPALIAARLGLRARGAGVGLCWALVLLLLLYAGPLLYSTAPSVRGPTRAQRLRNLVFAPLAEEFVFRGVLSAILVADGKASASRAGLVCLCPLFFGVAHVHHLWELCYVCGRPLRDGLKAVSFQMAYTTAFGAFATALLLQTGTLAAPVAAHVFCNAQGVPPLRAVWKHSLRARIVLLTGILAFVVALWRLWAQPPALTGL